MRAAVSRYELLAKLDRDVINGMEHSEDFFFRFTGQESATWSKLTIVTKLLIGTEKSRRHHDDPGAIMANDRDAALEAVAMGSVIHMASLNAGDVDAQAKTFVEKAYLPAFSGLLGLVLTDFLRTIDRYCPAFYRNLQRLPHRTIRVHLGLPFASDAEILGYVKAFGEPGADEGIDHARSSTGSFSSFGGDDWTLHVFTPHVLFFGPYAGDRETYVNPLLASPEDFRLFFSMHGYEEAGASIAKSVMDADAYYFVSWLRTVLHELTHELTGEWKKTPKIYREGLVEYLLWKIGSARLKELRSITSTLETKTVDETVLDPGLRRQLLAVYAMLVERATDVYTELQDYWKDWDQLYQEWFGVEVLARGVDYLRTFTPSADDIEAGRAKVIPVTVKVTDSSGQSVRRQSSYTVPVQDSRFAFDVESSLVIKHATGIERSMAVAVGLQSTLRDALESFRHGFRSQRASLVQRTQGAYYGVHAQQRSWRAEGEEISLNRVDADLWAKTIGEMDGLLKLWDVVFEPLTDMQDELNERGGNIAAIPKRRLEALTEKLLTAGNSLAEHVRNKVGLLASRTVVAGPGSDLGPDSKPINDYGFFLKPAALFDDPGPSGATAILDALIQLIGAYLMVPRYQDAVFALAKGSKEAKKYLKEFGPEPGVTTKPGAATNYASTIIGPAQDALALLGDAADGGYLEHGLHAAYTDVLAGAASAYLSLRSFDQQLADELVKLDNITEGWPDFIKRFGDMLAGRFRLLLPSLRRQMVRPAARAKGSFNFPASARNMLTGGISPDKMMVTTFAPALQNIHLAILLDLSYSMKGAAGTSENRSMANLTLTSRDDVRELDSKYQGHELAVTRLSLAMTMAAAAVGGVLKDADTIRAVYFSESAVSVPVEDVESFLQKSRYMDQKYSTAFKEGQSYAAAYGNQVLELERKLRRAKTPDVRENIEYDLKQARRERDLALQRAASSAGFPEDLQKVFSIEGEGARLDLALRRLEEDGFYAQTGTKLVFIFTDGSPELGARNPLEDGPVQAEVVRQLTVHRGDAQFLCAFISPETTEYEDLLKGEQPEELGPEKHLNPSLDIRIYTETVDKKVVRHVHYDQSPYWPPLDGRTSGTALLAHYEKDLGLQPVRFRVMATDDWVRRLRETGVTTVLVRGTKRTRDYTVGGRHPSDNRVNIERAFNDYVSGVDRLVRDAVARGSVPS